MLNRTLLPSKLLPITNLRNNPFLSIQNSIDQAMANFYTNLKPLSSEDWEKFSINPAADIVEGDNDIKIEIEMPGMGPEDIKLTINNNTLTIFGEKTTSKQDKGKNYLTREISYGHYERCIPIPNYLDTNKAEASFKKGMLWIRIPKKNDHENFKQEIKIKSA
jgi:HSP20 family protein